MGNRDTYTVEEGGFDGERKKPGFFDPLNSAIRNALDSCRPASQPYINSPRWRERVKFTVNQWGASIRVEGTIEITGANDLWGDAYGLRQLNSWEKERELENCVEETCDELADIIENAIWSVREQYSGYDQKYTVIPDLKIVIC